MEHEPSGPEKRRLAAVVFADVAGFSRLMAQDDLWTSKRWKLLREDLLLPLLERHEGRLVETAGDAILLEFKSIVAALNWALDTQSSLRSVASEEDEDPLQLRISVNVEDVLVHGENIFGDGVNIASRIHDAAEPGQIVVTSLVRELVGNRANVRFIDLGVSVLIKRFLASIRGLVGRVRWPAR